VTRPPPDGASSIAALIDDVRGADFVRRDQALGELVRRGGAAVPALIQAVASGDPELRGSAVNALAEIAEPSCAELFAQLAGDPDGRVRAHAADGLARLGDPRAVDALVRTIDDRPDELHHPSSLSAATLIGMGPGVLARVAPLLSAPGEATRMRALFVIRAIVDAQGEDSAARWRELGSYRAGAPAADREAAAEQWRAWLAARFP
jgi:HEAT repeat protein